jgi:putative hydrolase of the HAD superfamily
MALRVVFFDAAGTLFVPRQPVGLSYATLARRFGVNADADSVAAGFSRVFRAAPALAFGTGLTAERLRSLEREWWRNVVKGTFAELGPFNDFEAYFDALFEFFADPANWLADPDAVSVLEDLKSRCLQLGVISNFDARLYTILEALGLAHFFDSITISSEAGHAKPAVEIFRVALTKHSVAPGEALHVGDSIDLDVVGANRAGVGAVLVGSEHNADSGSLIVRARISRLEELAKLVTLELS